MARLIFPLIFLLFGSGTLCAQDTTALHWTVTSKKTGDHQYQLRFTTEVADGWDLYAPNQSISGIHSAELSFPDSLIIIDSNYREAGRSRSIINSIFDNSSFRVFNDSTTWEVNIRFDESVPGQLSGTLKYTFGKKDQFYPLSPFDFNVALEGGIQAAGRIKITSFDAGHPKAACGDENVQGKTLWKIFLLGLVGGLIALLTPCVFPLIPLTVSFFTKQAGGEGRGIGRAVLYGFFIFLIYLLLSVPFHLLDHLDPEILNNLSTNIWLNLVFFVIFVVFAISFFGYFEITLPGSVTNAAGAKSGASNLAGIFFMALTLAVVSFSCTGPILGSLLAGALSNNGGAVQLSVGMAGFGFGLALPFAIFAMFPSWLHSLPKSGGWLNSVKVVLGFLELAMAIKFLSNADLVEQWGVIKRELFIGFWVLIGLMINIYLLGSIHFPHDGPETKFSKTRIGFIAFFSACTLYLIPGLTNTPAANLKLISGFPPPLCYSFYTRPVNCEKGVEPLKNDFEAAMQLARKEHKPLLIDFTGWACVNCRRMEENVWTDPDVKELMQDDFVVVSLYVDERKNLPATEQRLFTTRDGSAKKIITVGDKWATFQSENFNAVSQPQYAIISPEEKVLTRTKFYTPAASEFAAWLRCGLNANK